MAYYHEKSTEAVKNITEAYDKAIEGINKEIENLYDNFNIEGNLSPTEARQLLNSPLSQSEMEELKKQVFNSKDETLKKYLLSKANGLVYKERLTRQEALKEKIYIEAKKLADVETYQSTALHADIINEAYYRTMFDIQKGLEVGFDFAQIPAKTIKTILNNPWSGEQFSDRVLKNTDVLAEKLIETVTSGMISGKSIPKMAQELEELSDIGKHAVNRLIRTETTYMANAGEMEGYKEAEIDKYFFLATLDGKTSEVCRKHDLKVYEIAKAVPGENMPPLHPYCRSTTMPYFGADTLAGIERRATDPKTGKTYKIPDGMNYEQWYKEYVADKHDKSKTDILKIKNKAIDKKEFEEYKELLGKEMPETLEESQELKYDNAKGSGKHKQVKKLNEWLADDKELLAEITEWYNEKPEWWGIDPQNTDVFYRTPQEVKEIRKKAGESGGHHPHGLALGGPEGQKLTPTGETAKVKNPTHSQVTGLQRRVINRIKK